MPELSAQAKVIRHWQQNPHDFVVQVFGVEPDAWQEQLMRDLSSHDRVAIRSGHGVGKTAALSWTIFWWLMTRYPCRVATTAPTAHQLSDILWGELSKWHEQMEPALKDLYEIKNDSVILKSRPKSCLAIARTARKEQPEAFQGQHSTHMLFIVDEASGVDDIIFEVGSGALSTPGAKLLMVGNPTRPSGYFFDAFHKMRADWCTHKIACTDAKMVDPSYPLRMARQYGEESNIYRIRVLGEFPSSEDSSVIPLGWLEAAVHREIELDHDAPVKWGVDVARFGDDSSALAKRKGRCLVEPIKVWKHKDIMQSVGIVVNEWDNTAYSMRPDAILVDSIGMGSGVVDRLKELGLPARGVNVAESPAVGDKFMRLRDELWWKAREWFGEKGCSIPGDQELIGELSAPTYEFTSSGKIKVEDKGTMKKRGVESPNRADAFNLTLHYAGSRRAWRAPIDYGEARVV